MKPEAWDAFASREPYFAVLTHPRFLRSNFDETAEEEFFRSGEDQVGDLYSRVLTTVAPKLLLRTVLEYGCGVGRLLIPFARRTEKVTGVDVSPAMLETARSHVERAGAVNVELLTTSDFESKQRTFDLVNCYLLFQRLPEKEGLALLRRLASCVRAGGVGVFHFPYRSRVSPLVRMTRTARARVPGLNAVANVVRKMPPSTPLIESNVYAINDVLAILQELAFDAPHLVFSEHGDMDSVIIHAMRRHQPAARAANETPGVEEEQPRDFIDVTRMIAETPIEELNAIAERYFTSLENWEYHLAKPFARIEDTPQLLISAGVVLQGLDLGPGMTVLEFGAGTGWLSRFLTQLGCRMILLDVSPTALRIARELYMRLPVIGERPQPQFLVFDGRRIELGDASVDRILSFDAFHHAPNPEEVLREMGRVLAPGGIAAFAEPGPHHSRTPQSQHEMRTYGVVENDVDIRAIWESAKRFGFVDLRLAAFNVPPFHVSLAEYEDLLAFGKTYDRWAESTRTFLDDVRVFFLRKAGAQTLDSRRPTGLRSEIHAEVTSQLEVRARIRNTGEAKWLPSSEAFGGVSLGCRLYDEHGKLLDGEFARRPLPRALAPNEETSLAFTLPAIDAGRYLLELDCVANLVTWFGQAGSNVTRVKVEVQ